MKQIIPFTKKIDFKTNVEEITSISLDKKVNEIVDNCITGVFDLYLEYKENDVSINTIEYSDNIPFSIELDNKYDLSNVLVDIDDFYYEIDDSSVTIYVDVLVDKLSYSEDELDEIFNRKVEIIDESVEKEESVDLFKEEKVPVYETFNEDKETYVTYKVHIVRGDDNIDTICNKYSITKEELSYYNNISSIKLGDKLIIPTYKK